MKKIFQFLTICSLLLTIGVGEAFAKDDEPIEVPQQESSSPRITTPTTSTTMYLHSSAARIRSTASYSNNVIIIAPSKSSLSSVFFTDQYADNGGVSWQWAQGCGIEAGRKECGWFQYDPAVMRPSGTAGSGYYLAMAVDFGGSNIRSSVSKDPSTIKTTINPGDMYYITSFRGVEALDNFQWVNVKTLSGITGVAQYDPAWMHPLTLDHEVRSISDLHSAVANMFSE